MALGENLLKKENKKEKVTESLQSSKETILEEHQEVEYKRLIQYCVFRAGEEEYAIPIDLIKEVVKFSSPAPLPQMPNHVLGMTNIRGNIYGVMDLELFFQVRMNRVDHKYLLVLDHDLYKMAIGIEDVPDSLIIEEDMLEELKSSTFKSTVSQKYLKGVIKKEDRMIIVFDIMGIIAGENFTITS